MLQVSFKHFRYYFYMNNKLEATVHLFLVNLIAISFLSLVIIPVILVVSLRWFDPPISAFMLGDKMTNLESTINYEWKDWNQISPSAPLAVVAAEDQYFTTHFGFDVSQLKQVLMEYQEGARIQSSTTITQQTAKNLFLWSGQNFLRTGLESWLTLLMETCLNKQRILEIYLNIVEFGQGIYGIEAASQTYFFKPASELSHKESALLAAVLLNPEQYRIDSPSAFIEQRQRWIMQQMKILGQSESLHVLAGSY